MNAPVPAHVTLPVVVKSAKTALKRTLDAAGPGKAYLRKCHTVNQHYGVCQFELDYTSSLSGKLYKCHGTIWVRDVGQGPQRSYGTVYCNGKKVN